MNTLSLRPFNRLTSIRLKSIAVIGVVALVLVLPATSTHAAEPAEIADRAAQDIEMSLSNEDLTRLDEVIANEPDALGLEAYGHVLLMQRHLDQAAYIFAHAVELSPNQGSALTALGATMGERLALADTATEEELEHVVELQSAALMVLPDEPTVHHNLGTALLRLAMAKGGDDKLVQRAINHLEIAVAGTPLNSLFRTRLAEALNALERIEQAQTAINDAFLTDPISPVLQTAMARGSLANYSPTPDTSMCNINFDCQRSCGGGIIGGINSVTCEMTQAGAINSCMRGEPHAISYNCEIEIPRYGIMIPGLYPGFSVLTPWGSFDLLVQGDGSLDYRAKLNTPNIGPIQFYMQVEGSYEPHSGAATWDYGGGVQYALFNRNDAMRYANQYDIGTQAAYHINPNRADPDEVRLEISRGTLVAM
jgi:Flp pilus assembly protein TadD